MAVTLTAISQVDSEILGDDFTSHCDKLKQAVDEAEAAFETIMLRLIKYKQALSSKQGNQPFLDVLSVSMGKTHKAVSKAQQDIHEFTKVTSLLKPTPNTESKVLLEKALIENALTAKPSIDISTMLELIKLISRNEKPNISIVLDKKTLKDENSKMDLTNSIKKTTFQQPTITPDMSLAERLKINQEILKNKFDQLYKQWCNSKNKLSNNTEGYILVTNLIIKHLNTGLSFSILADDVTNFKKFFTEKVGDILCFELCCLCGSEKIIKEVYLKDPEKIKCLTLSEHAIAYALSSGNENLATLLAQKGVELKKENPGHVRLYCFGNYKAAKNIQELFTSTTKNSM